MKTEHCIGNLVTGTILILVLTINFVPVSYAAGELLISPTRIVFEKHTRTASVSMVNAGNETYTYRIEFVQRRMKPDGSFEEINKSGPGEQFSADMIRFSPRQVTLQPGQAQSIRLMLRKPPKLKDGEYRSHMLFRAIPKASSSSVAQLNNDPKAISIQLTPIVGISIPVIVRHGQTQVTTTISKLRYYEKNSTVLFELMRSGNASVYGDITILFKDQSGHASVLRKVNGLAVYTPNKSRRMNIPTQILAGVKIKNGTLSVLFHQTKEAGGALITEKSIKIP